MQARRAAGLDRSATAGESFSPFSKQKDHTGTTDSSEMYIPDLLQLASAANKVKVSKLDVTH